MKILFLFIIASFSVILITSCEDNDPAINFNIINDDPSNFKAEIGFNIPKDQNLSEVRQLTFDIIVSPDIMEITDLSINRWSQCAGINDAQITKNLFSNNPNMMHVTIDFPNGINPTPRDTCLDVSQETTVDLICTGVEPVGVKDSICHKFIQVSIVDALVKMSDNSTIILGQESYIHNNCE